MEIKAFTLADLETTLSSDDFWHAKILPITKHKALSSIHNPRADMDDTLLLVAYQDDQVIGYLGILPDKLFDKNTEYKIGWLTGWWVDPACTRTGVGAILLFKALNAYQQRLGVSGASTDARRVLAASQMFVPLKTLKGLDIKLRLNVTAALRRKTAALRAFRILFKIVDNLTDEFQNFRWFFWKRRNDILDRLNYEYISAIDEETGRFIQRYHQHDLMRRGTADLNWMMRYPWVLSTPSKDAAGERYFFSSHAQKFYHLGVKVFEPNNKMVGFFILKVRDDRLSVVYSYFDSRYAPAIVTAAVHQAMEMDVSTLSLNDEQLVASFSKLRCPCWTTKTVSRGFSLSKALADIPPDNYRLQGGDGDLAFY